MLLRCHGVLCHGCVADEHLLVTQSRPDRWNELQQLFSAAGVLGAQGMQVVGLII